MSVTPSLAAAVVEIERGIRDVARLRLNPLKESQMRLLLAQLGRIGIASTEALSERCRGPVENLLLVLEATFKDLPPQMIPVALRCAFFGALVAMQAYEAAGQPGVLQGLSRLEACYASDEQGLVCMDYDDLHEVAFELVTALKMQGGGGEPE